MSKCALCSTHCEHCRTKVPETVEGYFDSKEIRTIPISKIEERKFDFSQKKISLSCERGPTK